MASSTALRFETSLGEVEALVIKAARGSGRAHGVAAEAGFAARWLVERGLDGVAALAGLLSDTDGIAHDELLGQMPGGEAPTGASCPLVNGIGLADGVLTASPPLGALLWPSVLLPFLAQALDWPECFDWVVEAEGASIILPRDGRIVGADWPRQACAVTWRMAQAQPVAAPLQMRAHPAVQDWQRLEALAARTYAPATQASRETGAGPA